MEHCETVTVMTGGQQFRYTAPGARTLSPKLASVPGLTGGDKDRYVASIKSQVVSMLKDPDAPKFRNVAYKEKADGAAVCGFVSGKNGYGAYGAESRFVATGKSLYLYNDGEANVPEAGRLAWYEFCD